jgi:hypothetical protein
MYQVLAMSGDFQLPHQPHWAQEFETAEAACEAARETYELMTKVDRSLLDAMVVFVHDAEADETCEDPIAVVVGGMLFKRA